MTLQPSRCVLFILGGLLALAAAAVPGCSEEPETAVEQIQELEKSGNVDALAKRAIEAEPTEGRLAVRSLARMGRKAEPALRQTMRKGNPPVRAEAALVYPTVTDRDKAQEPLSDLARDDAEPYVRAAAVTALGHMRAMDSMETLFAALNDPNPVVRRRAADAVTRIMGRSYELFVNGPEEKRLTAIEGLRQDWSQEQSGIRKYFKRDRK